MKISLPRAQTRGKAPVKGEPLGTRGRDHYQVMPMEVPQGAAVTGGVSREFPRELPPLGAVGSPGAYSTGELARAQDVVHEQRLLHVRDGLVHLLQVCLVLHLQGMRVKPIRRGPCWSSLAWGPHKGGIWDLEWDFLPGEAEMNVPRWPCCGRPSWSCRFWPPSSRILAFYPALWQSSPCISPKQRTARCQSCSAGLTCFGGAGWEKNESAGTWRCPLE